MFLSPKFPLVYNRRFKKHGSYMIILPSAATLTHLHKSTTDICPRSYCQKTQKLLRLLFVVRNTSVLMEFSGSRGHELFLLHLWSVCTDLWRHGSKQEGPSYANSHFTYTTKNDLGSSAGTQPTQSQSINHTMTVQMFSVLTQNGFDSSHFST